MNTYTGVTAVVPLGGGGIFTDGPHSRIPSTKLVRAKNCTLYNGVAEKDPGSRRWNTSALPSGIVAFKDWWPDPFTQRLIAVCRNGKVYRFKDAYNYAEVAASDLAPATLRLGEFTTISEVGSEEQSRSKKLFILTGQSPVQVIAADGTIRTNLSNPAADWTTNRQPFGAIVHRSSVFAWGNNPDGMYASLATDHEDFTGLGVLLFNIYPGQSERIVDAWVYKDTLFCAKYPKGIYRLVETDTNTDNWYFTRASFATGASSPQGHCEGVDDLYIADSQGSISMLKASLYFSGFQASNVFNALGVKRFVKNEILASAYQTRQAYWYEHKQEALFALRGPSSTVNNRIARLSFNAQQPELTWIEKDQPNCLGPLRDVTGIDRPAYGAEDGFIYVMDQEDRWVGDRTVVQNGYQFEITTPHLNFSQGNMELGEAVKAFEFLELVYEPTGKFDLLVDIFIDGAFSNTVRFSLEGNSELDLSKLDVMRLDDGCEHRRLVKISGSGRRIAFRCYNAGVGQNVRLVELRVYFQVTGQEQRK